MVSFAIGSETGELIMKKLTLAAAMLAITFTLGGCADDDDYHSGYYYRTSSYPNYSIYTDGYSPRYYSRYSDRYYGWGY
jgi:hypothetical protein